MTIQSQPSKELEGLLVESGEQAIDSVLREVLEPYLAFTRGGQMITKAQFLKLSDPSKLLAALLGRQAMVRLQLPSASAEATADQLHDLCGVPLKSTREYLSRYKSHRLLDKNEAGYFIPTWAIAQAADALRK
jgi:hypothetical protein